MTPVAKADDLAKCLTKITQLSDVLVRLPGLVYARYLLWDGIPILNKSVCFSSSRLFSFSLSYDPPPVSKLVLLVGSVLLFFPRETETYCLLKSCEYCAVRSRSVASGSGQPTKSAHVQEIVGADVLFRWAVLSAWTWDLMQGAQAGFV